MIFEDTVFTLKGVNIFWVDLFKGIMLFMPLKYDAE